MESTCASKLGLSPVQEFYKDKTIFVTGATGFVGKAILEKLLRTCGHLKKIYILLRAKKGLDVDERLEKLIQSSIFDTLRTKDPSFAHKIIPIKGDITLPDLGISEEDQIMLEQQVNVVLHCAATVKFNERLNAALDVNFHGTRKVFELSQRMKNLLAFVHISTAYSNAERSQIDEVVYQLLSREEIDDLVWDLDGLTDTSLDEVTPMILNEKPNTYTFTKALAENYLEYNKGRIPISIVRPSIVTATIDQPVEGWVDNVNAVTGLMVSIGKGLLRTLLVDGKKHIDIIPVDFLANLTIVSGWKAATGTLNQRSPNAQESNELTVYNCCSVNPQTYDEFLKTSISINYENPFDDVIWYPTMQFVQSPWLYWFLDLLYHRVPAFCIDKIRLARPNNLKMTMTQLYHKVNDSALALGYFMVHDWKFTNHNVKRLFQQLTQQDRELFPMFVREIYWPYYITNYVLGIRRYVLRDQDQELDRARNSMKRKLWWHRLLKVSICTPPLLLSYFVFTGILRRIR